MNPHILSNWGSGHPIGQSKTGAECKVNMETNFTFSWGDKTCGKAQDRGKDGAMASFSFKIYFVLTLLVLLLLLLLLSLCVAHAHHTQPAYRSQKLLVVCSLLWQQVLGTKRILWAYFASALCITEPSCQPHFILFYFDFCLLWDKVSHEVWPPAHYVAISVFPACPTPPRSGAVSEHGCSCSHLQDNNFPAALSGYYLFS